MKASRRASALAILAFAFCGAANAQTLGILATQPGSATHSISTAIAKTIVEKAGLQARVQSQGASALYGIDAGTADLGLANAYDNIFFFTGTGEYEREGKHPNLRIAHFRLNRNGAIYVFGEHWMTFTKHPRAVVEILFKAGQLALVRREDTREILWDARRAPQIHDGRTKRWLGALAPCVSLLSPAPCQTPPFPNSS